MTAGEPASVARGDEDEAWLRANASPGCRFEARTASGGCVLLMRGQKVVFADIGWARFWVEQEQKGKEGR